MFYRGLKTLSQRKQVQVPVTSWPQCRALFYRGSCLFSCDFRDGSEGLPLTRKHSATKFHSQPLCPSLKASYLTYVGALSILNCHQQLDFTHKQNLSDTHFLQKTHHTQPSHAWRHQEALHPGVCEHASNNITKKHRNVKERR